MLIIKKIFNVAVYFFALIGFVLTSGFFAIRLHLTDTKGAVDKYSSYYELSEDNVKNKKVLGIAANNSDSLAFKNLDSEIDRLKKIKELKRQNYCKIKIIGDFFPVNAKAVLIIDDMVKSDSLTAKSISAINLQLLENQNFQNKFSTCEMESNLGVVNPEDLKNIFSNIAVGDNAFFWTNSEEWNAIREATIKDKAVIEKVSQKTNVDQRLLVSCLIGEQLRLFNSQREIFKKFFEPLKILGNANKISLGVMGIKEATAEQVEKNLKDTTSPYYLGKEYENILDDSSGKSRYEKLTEESHYFSYLYGAIYLKQIMKQWRTAGYDIKYRPEIVGTLFNVGFPQSKPKPDPKVGGSTIKINGAEYSFGRLSYEFYYSGELLDTFPFNTTTPDV